LYFSIIFFKLIFAKQIINYPKYFTSPQIDNINFYDLNNSNILANYNFNNKLITKQLNLNYTTDNIIFLNNFCNDNKIYFKNDIYITSLCINNDKINIYKFINNKWVFNYSINLTNELKNINSNNLKIILNDKYVIL
jgi:hypothetical protein